MILFRVDGNKEIGTGHVMRCLSIAKALRGLGEDVTFVLADTNALQLITKNGFEAKILGSEYRCLDAELDTFLFYIKECQKRKEQILLVIDSYFVTDTYFDCLRKEVLIAYIDDFQDMKGCVDYLINYNVYADVHAYGETIGKETLLGCGYAPLREEFLDREYQIRTSCNSILITTGGADKYNIATKVLKEMFAEEFRQMFNRVEIHVVVGMFHEHKADLEEIASEYANVILHQNVSNMSEIMHRCDLAITAAGSTIYELSCVGVPSISFSFVDNQDQIVEGFAALDAIKCAGYYLENPESMIKRVVELTAELINDPEERVRLSKTAHALVDGKGAQRIAMAIQSWCSS